MGETIKQRDYMFDTFRGLLMWSIPISHLRGSQVISVRPRWAAWFITINVFVMQAFVFPVRLFFEEAGPLKGPHFHTFMWPYLLGIPFFLFCTTILLRQRDPHWDLPRRSRSGICGRSSSIATLPRNG